MNLPNPMDLLTADTNPMSISPGFAIRCLELKIKELTLQVQDLRAENARLREMLNGTKGKPE